MKRVFLPVIVMLALAALLLLFLMVSTGDASSKPDIIMTPSHTDYLTVYYTLDGSLVLDYDDISSGKLRCLPHRP